MVDVKHVVGFSGGAASSVTAKIISDKYPNNTILLFHDTKSEPEDNYRFRNDVAKYIKLPITDFSYGKNIWELFDQHKMIANNRIAFCSKTLKRDMSIKYLKNNKPNILYLGFTAEEKERALISEDRYAQQGIEVKFPLIEKNITKEQCYYTITNCWNIQLPKMYDWANHANCIPCVRGGMAYWGCIYMFERESWNKMNIAEHKFGHSVLKQGTLQETLPKCLELANKYLNKKINTETLIDFPCECSI